MKHDKWITVVFLSIYMIRLVIFGTPGLADAFIVLFLSCLYGWRMYLESIQKPDIAAELQKKLNEVNMDIAALKNNINVVKLTSGIKNEKTSFKF